jgi:hypothetical protein
MNEGPAGSRAETRGESGFPRPRTWIMAVASTSPHAKVTRQGESRDNIVSPLVDPARRFPGLFASTSSEPLTENQRALPVFWKCP